MEDSKKINPNISPKTPRAKAYHERFYLTRSLKAIEQINNIAVTVFVCGPSGPSDSLAKKKVDTINELRNLGHDANSGEELVSELKLLDKDPNKTVNVYENIAAAQSELVIIFCASPGSIGETHEFLNIPEIARKTLIFVEKKHLGGYGGQGVLEMHKKMNGLLETYEEEDISSCRLLGKATDWVKNFQSVKWMSKRDFFR